MILPPKALQLSQFGSFSATSLNVCHLFLSLTKIPQRERERERACSLLLLIRSRLGIHIPKLIRNLEPGAGLGEAWKKKNHKVCGFHEANWTQMVIVLASLFHAWYFTIHHSS